MNFQYLSFFTLPEKLTQFFLSNTFEISSGQLGSKISLHKSKSIVKFLSVFIVYIEL